MAISNLSIGHGSFRFLLFPFCFSLHLSICAYFTSLYFMVYMSWYVGYRFSIAKMFSHSVKYTTTDDIFQQNKPSCCISLIFFLYNAFASHIVHAYPILISIFVRRIYHLFVFGNCFKLQNVIFFCSFFQAFTINVDRVETLKSLYNIYQPNTTYMSIVHVHRTVKSIFPYT